MFNWLKSLFVKRSGVTGGDFLKDLSSRSGTGEIVTPDKALGLAAFYRGVDLISSTVAKVPFIVYKRSGQEGRNRDPKHPAYSLLKTAVSPTMTSFIWFKTMQNQAIRWGNSYSYIRRDSFAEPIEIVLLSPTQTRLTEVNGQMFYTTVISNQVRMLPLADVVHIKGLSSDGYTGLPFTQVCKESIGEGLGMQRYTTVYFRQNGRPSFIIKLPRALTDKEDIELYRETFSHWHAGIENAHRPALIEQGADLVPLGGNNETGQLKELREYNIVEIANILGVPPSKLGSAVNTSYASLEADALDFLANSIDHWLIQWESELSLKLLREVEKIKDSHFIEATREALHSTDLKTLEEVIDMQLNNGRKSLNECRKLKNDPEIKLPEADKYRMPANLKYIDDKPPEPPAPFGAPGEDPETGQEQGQEQGQETGQETGQEVKAAIVGRLMTRLGRQLASKVKRPDFSQWVAADFVEAHRAVFVQTLAPILPDADIVAEVFLGNLAEELTAVTRPEVEAVLDRYKQLLHKELNGKTL